LKQGAVLAAAALLAFLTGSSLRANVTARSGPKSPIHSSCSGSSDKHRHPRSAVGEVHFFAYGDRAGERIRFLLAHDSTGQTKAAFDACRRCYVYRKGYVSSDGNLICRYCGNHYRLETIESGLASCVPVKLPIDIWGQTVTIKSTDLERERGLF
jgi:FtrD-like iron-sulfur protein